MINLVKVKYLQRATEATGWQQLQGHRGEGGVDKFKKFKFDPIAEYNAMLVINNFVLRR